MASMGRSFAIPPPRASRLRKEDFGTELPTRFFTGSEGRRQEILLETLGRLEEASMDSAYHQKALRNLQRWSAEAGASGPKPHVDVRVLPGDWGEVTLQVTREFGTIFASLNMANAVYPGGGYTHGMVAQEENMFRRTDCHFAVLREHLDEAGDEYKADITRTLNAVGGRVELDVAQPRVCIRGPEDRSTPSLGYCWLADDEIFPFYELRAAAVDLRGGQAFSPDETRRRVAAQLDTLIDKGVRHAVLSAFGCGAFRNPAAQVAAIYRDELQKRTTSFDVIAFGIFNAGYGPDNFTPFQQAFANFGA